MKNHLECGRFAVMQQVYYRWAKMAIFYLSFFPYFLLSAPLNVAIQGEKALLINADSGVVLFEKDADVPCYPASVTKIATALYAVQLKGDELDMLIEAEQESLVMLSQAEKIKSSYKVPSYWLEPDGMHMGIKKGEIFSLHDLLRGMLIHSANDAANVIAHALGPSIPVFMKGLNHYLQTLGCKQTVFLNPHGLHDPQHVTTAHDLALIAREALKHSVLNEIVSQTRFLRPKTNKQAATTLLQTNRLLRPGKFYYSKAIGLKTGYHAKAKKTFIGAARLDDRTLIAVLLGYPNQNLIFQDAITFFEMAFNQPKMRRFYLKKGPQAFKKSLAENQVLTTYLAEDLSLDYYPAEDPIAKCFLYWHPLALPISKNQVVGEVHLVSSQGQRLKSIPLLAEQSLQPSAFYHQLSHFSFSWWGIIVIFGLMTLFLWLRAYPKMLEKKI